MLSVCIPVFNTEVKQLVDALLQQLRAVTIEWEILIVDDGSSVAAFKEVNRLLGKTPGVKYFEFDINKGRSAARNFLAEQSLHQWLLFLDADSILIGEYYIQNYVAALTPLNRVFIGGRMCGSKPAECVRRLHWAYCRIREGNNNKHAGFASNNFCIQKKQMLLTPFATSLSGWGHEDTDLGLQLKKQGISPLKIDNPVLHQQLEDATVFLQKAETAVSNLLQLRQRWGNDLLARDVKLYKWYQILLRLHLKPLILVVWRSSRKIIIHQLSGCKPSLVLFDFYRLGYLFFVGNGK